MSGVLDRGGAIQGVMSAMVVYGDLLFLANLVEDGLLLWAVATLSGRRISAGRLLLGAVLGALYGTLAVVEGGVWWNPAAKLVASLLVLVFTFVPFPWLGLGRLLVLFYALSFGLGGIDFGLYYLLGRSQAFAGPVPAWIPLVGTGLGYVLVRATSRFLRVKGRREGHRVEMEIRFAGRVATLQALVDTGNQLRDPFKGHPVVVVEKGALGDLLPGEVQQWLNVAGLEGIDPGTVQSPWVGRLRLVPFQAVGQRQGIMLGFKPDAVFLGGEGTSEVVVALAEQRLSTTGDYRALVPSALVDCLRRGVA